MARAIRSGSVIVGAALAAGCGPKTDSRTGGTAGAGATGGGASTGACTTRLPDETATLTPPKKPEPIESRITVDVAATKQRIAREIAARIPKTLASAKRQRVGAPGEVSYTVRRGAFDVGLADNRVVVSTPVSAEVEVCKPLGPFCPTYGRCSPRFAATVSVPLSLTPNYDLGASRVSIATVRGCVLRPVGLDVTGEVNKQTRRQATALQRRIDSSVPPLEKYVGVGWRLLHVPVALDADTCLEVSPQKLVHAPPKLDGDTLSLRAGALVTVDVARPCRKETERPKPTALPPPSLDAKLPSGIDVRVPIRVAWAEVSAALTRALTAAAPGSPPITAVVARGTSDGLALTLSLGGPACGEVVVTARPWWDPETSRVRLRKVAIAPGQPGRAAALDTSALARWVESTAAVPLPIDVNAAPAKLRQQVAKLTDDLPPGVEARVEMSAAKVEPIVGSAESLIPVLALGGTARASAK